MKTRMSKASIEAWYEINGIGLTNRQMMRVAELVRRHRKPCSNNEISRMTELPINAVSARVNALVHLGVLVREPELSPCPITGRRASKVKHAGIK